MAYLAWHNARGIIHMEYNASDYNLIHKYITIAIIIITSHLGVSNIFFQYFLSLLTLTGYLYI